MSMSLRERAEINALKAKVEELEQKVRELSPNAKVEGDKRKRKHNGEAHA